jgi:hypothetical protein
VVFLAAHPTHGSTGSIVRGVRARIEADGESMATHPQAVDDLSLVVAHILLCCVFVCHLSQRLARGSLRARMNRSIPYVMTHGQYSRERRPSIASLHKKRNSLQQHPRHPHSIMPMKAHLLMRLVVPRLLRRPMISIVVWIVRMVVSSISCWRLVRSPIAQFWASSVVSYWNRVMRRWRDSQPRSTFDSTQDICDSGTIFRGRRIWYYRRRNIRMRYRSVCAIRVRSFRIRSYRDDAR